MKNTGMLPESSAPIAPSYEGPTLTLVGDAADVVLGLPGEGWDGPYGMSLTQFEFETDDAEIGG
jgi:hypothetical protein